MFAKHSPPTRHKQIAPSMDHGEGRKKGDTLGVKEVERESLAVEIRTMSQSQSVKDNVVVTATSSTDHQAGEKGSSDRESQSGSVSNSMTKKSQNPVDDKPLKEACSDNAKANESKAGGSTVGKLSATMYRPSGVRSRSASLPGSEAAICKGLPHCQMATVETRRLILMRPCS